MGWKYGNMEISGPRKPAPYELLRVGVYARKNAKNHKTSVNLNTKKIGITRVNLQKHTRTDDYLGGGVFSLKRGAIFADRPFFNNH